MLLVSVGKQPTGYDWENGHVHSAVSEAMTAKIEEARDNGANWSSRQNWLVDALLPLWKHTE